MEVHKATAEDSAFISLGLFLNVKNAGKLRSEAASGKLGAVLLDPTLVMYSCSSRPYSCNV